MVLLSNITETLFNDVVRIRLENDARRIKDFGPYEKQVRRKWNEFKEEKRKRTLSNKEYKENLKAANENLKNMFMMLCK